MANQRNPDSTRQPEPLPADGEAFEPDAEGNEPGADPADVGLVAYLARRRKMIAALVAVPVAYVFVKLGLDGALGVELSDELELTVVTAITAAVVERIRNAGTLG